MDELTSIVAGEVVVAGDSIILIPVDLAGTSGDTAGDLNRFANCPFCCFTPDSLRFVADEKTFYIT